MGTRILLYLAIAAAVIFSFWYMQSETGGVIKVGILHSTSGTMAISEKSVVDATLLAIDELNERGGIHGKTIEAVIADGRSDWPTFASEAERLILEDQVNVIFGCWTSASRKMVRSVVERHNHLLFYPVQYEGLEQSPNIVYTGAAPNQQIIPAVKWCMDHLGKKFFLAGSDYVFPRTANAIIKEQVASLKGEIVGEEYVLLGSKNVKNLVDKILEANPAVILNTINGDTNVAFFRELRSRGVTSARIPTMSFSIAEDELRSMSSGDMIGDYAAWNYFQSLDSAANSTFVRRFKARYGDSRVTDDPMEAAYFGVHLWAQAVEEAGTADAESVRKSIHNQSLEAPEGIVFIDGTTQHTWKTVRIGKIQQNGQFAPVWTSGKPIRPVPYPIYRSRAEWDEFLNDLYVGWGRKWAKT